MTLQELIDEWRDLDAQERLEVLVELAGELPPLSEGRRAVPRPAACRVQECQTPVWLWVDVIDGRVHLEADVPRESPTVRGLVALVAQLVRGASPQEVLALPDDLLPALGLHEALGMTRRQGLKGVMLHIQREVRRQSAMCTDDQTRTSDRRNST
uniref:SufE family protein n=1 Tax=Schlesneria paludicola TaxID=360056 RepID=A0A7C4LM58_9PLAN